VALAVRWPAASVRAYVTGEADGTSTLDALHLAGGGRPSPLDIAETAELGALPEVEGATLTVQYRFTQGPFGDVEYWWSFDEGRSVGMGLGVAADPDVRVRITFASMVGVRRGELTIFEALEYDGRVDGDLGPLMLLAGLEESPGVRAAESACGPSGPVLGALGRVTAPPAWQEARQRLAAVTT
jgi:hypothetical protein